MGIENWNSCFYIDALKNISVIFFNFSHCILEHMSQCYETLHYKRYWAIVKQRYETRSKLYFENFECSIHIHSIYH